MKLGNSSRRLQAAARQRHRNGHRTGAASVIDAARAGTADNVSTHEIQNLPTIQRSLTDIARTSPYFSPRA